jgi:23S rRNA pseudouridine1911/1915/1917 synthase
MPPVKVSRHRFEVRGRHEGRRIDAYLAARFTDCSRTYFQRLLKTGEITVNGRPVKPSTSLRYGDVVEGEVAVDRPAAPMPESIPLDILHEDDDLIAISKPSGLVVHPARGHASGTLVNALLHHCRALAAGRGGDRAGIVHRLDRDTSGVLVACKDDRIRSRLATQFEHRKVRKTYLALVEGTPELDSGLLRYAIGRH